MSIKNTPQIYPDDFFNIPHPTSPWVSIQFRTKALDDLTDTNQWEEITINPSNFFDNVTIDDASGFQQVELVLTDPYFTKLESLITRSIIAVRSKNKLTDNSESGKFKASQSDKEQIFQFKIDNTSLVNFRIRFGYGNFNDGTSFIDDTSFSGDYKKRGNGGTVLRTPWIYLQILNVVFKLTEFGLQATITAISTIENWLEKARMLRRFYVFKDTPEGMLKWAQRTIQELSNKEITVNFEAPLQTSNEQGGHEIEIPLGEEPDEKKGAVNLRTVKSFLNELCSKIPPRIYKADNSSIPNGEDKQGTAGEDLDRTCHYTYSFQPDPSAKNKWILNFYYPDPIEHQQSKLRTYVWREYGKSIVKNFEVESKTDWAALNYPLAIFNKSFRNVDSQLFVATSASQSSDHTGQRVVGSTDISNSLQTQLSNMKISFVSDVVNVSGKAKELPSMVAQQIVHFLNQGVFNGTLSLQGDPFFLFDSIVRPYEYILRIVILRPGYLDEDGSYTGTGSLKQSYLSGYYTLGKISHKIDANGFETILNLTRWPMKEDQSTVVEPRVPSARNLAR